MAEFQVVDLSGTTPSPQPRSAGRGQESLGRVDTGDIARQLGFLRDDIDQLFQQQEHLGLKSVAIKLAITAEGRVAFIAKGTLEASVEVVFERR